MADDWFYAQKQARHGPVPFTKLQSLAKAGWLTPEDLVWGPGMWRVARTGDRQHRQGVARVS